MAVGTGPKTKKEKKKKKAFRRYNDSTREKIDKQHNRQNIERILAMYQM